jgi:PAS domain S-box-containing protein
VGWLFLGVVYSSAYAWTGSLLRNDATTLSLFRAVALLVPPLCAAYVIVQRRQVWRGCQWLFWATIALGLAMQGLGLTGWAADELLSQHTTWLAWPAIFTLFGSVAPLFALLAQPHRGARDPLAATTAIDIAGLAVVTGFLYSFFVVTPQAGPSGEGSAVPSLLIVSEMQQVLVVAALIAATVTARRTPWRDTYWRLALGSMVSFATLTLSNLQAGHGLYRSGFVYDFTWILPFAFYPWAAAQAPVSEESTLATADERELARPRPWVIFTAVAMLPFLDFGLRRLAPDEALNGFRDLTTAVTLISVLPLLVARIAAERAELQQAGSTTRLLEQVIGQAQDLILVLTPDGRCCHANAAFCRAAGLSLDELRDWGLRDQPSGGAISMDDLLSKVRAGGTWRGTLMRKHGDGAVFPVSATVAALWDKHGKITHIVSVERDISEERRLREQLIHNERLSAVGQLVAGVAHELNNPLQAVLGISELLLGDETSPERRRDLEQVRTHGERAAKIVRHLLSFARRSALERSITDLNEVVQATLSLRAYEHKIANITVREDYAADLPVILVNREEVQQVVLNLILNAEHAVRSAGRVGIIGAHTCRRGEWAVLEITDNGPGVPADLAGRIFEPFFTTRETGKGSGLGLSVSLGIAEAHGGTLALGTAEVGACFTFSLPLTASLAADDLRL